MKYLFIGLLFAVVGYLLPGLPTFWSILLVALLLISSLGIILQRVDQGLSDNFLYD